MPTQPSSLLRAYRLVGPVDIATSRMVRTNARDDIEAGFGGRRAHKYMLRREKGAQREETGRLGALSIDQVCREVSRHDVVRESVNVR